jgi:DNA-binding beta-propeller fold protein YncE
VRGPALLLLLLAPALGACSLDHLGDTICSAAAFGLVDGCDIGSSSPDAGPPRLDAVDGSGRVGSFSDEAHGSGVPLGRPSHVVLDEARGRAIVSDTAAGLIGVDLGTRDRSLLSGDGAGAGPALDGPTSLAFDAADDRLFVLSPVLAALFVVDAATGDRSVLSSTTVGAGPAFAAGAIAWDAAGGRVLMAAQGLHVLYAVDPDTGARSLLSGDTRGGGPPFGGMRGVVADPAGGRAYVCDVSMDAILSVDLATGDRTIVAGPGVGTGPAMGNMQILVLGPGAGEAQGLDWDTDRILRIDLATGDRTVFVSSGLDGRTSWSMARSVSLDRLLVTRY